MPMDRKPERGLLGFLRRIYGVFLRSAQTFFSALPLFLFWLIIPLALLVLSSLYQSVRLLSERNDSARKETILYFVGPDSEVFALHISSPKKLRINANKPYDDSISIWLTSSGSTTVQEENLKYAFRIAIDKGLAHFVTENGDPLPGIVALSPAIEDSTVHLLYLKSNPASLQKDEDITLIIGTLSSSGKLQRIYIPVESPVKSQMRSFWDTVLGLPALVGGLLTAIAGFALQQMKVLNEEDQKGKTELEEATSNRMEEARKQGGYSRAFDIYQDYLGRVGEPNHKIKGIFEDHIYPQKAIQEIAAELKRSDFRKAIEIYQEYSNIGVKGLEPIWNELLNQTFYERLISNLPVKDFYDLLQANSFMTAKIQKLWDVRENYFHYEEKITVVTKLRQLFRPWSEIIVFEGYYPKQQKANAQAGMDFLGIVNNPFGAENAEEDFLFSSRVDFNKDEKTVFSIASDLPLDLSQLILGSHGSGKTALAFFLAGKSFSQDEKTFPVYCKISSKEDVQDLLEQIIEILLNYYIKNSDEFFEQDISRQAAFSVLLSNYLPNRANLPFRLNLSGVSKDTGGAAFYSQLIKLAESARGFKLTIGGIPRLLLQILPPAYNNFLFLLDWQDTPKSLSRGSRDILDFIRRMQHERGVTFKVFSGPSSLSNFVAEDLQFPTVKIDWSFEGLKEVLTSRIENAGIPGLGYWFGVEIRNISTQLLLKSAGKTPGGLIRKGNQLLKFIGENKRILRLKDAETIFGAILVRQILNESMAAQ